MDLITTDENGRPWDVDCIHMRNTAMRKVLQDKPTLLIGSQMCTDFCSWINVNHPRMPKQMVAERPRKARLHLDFCIKLYAIQVQHSRCFLHDHPLAASAWNEACIQRLLGKHGVVKVSADQCQY